MHKSHPAAPPPVSDDRRRRRLLLSAAGVAITCAALPALAQPVDAAALARTLSPDREQKLLAGARKEGEVSVYTSLTSEEVIGLAAAFEKKYGVKVKTWRASSEKILQRTLTEARASRFEVDVIETNGPELEALYRERLLLPLASPHASDGQHQPATPAGV